VVICPKFKAENLSEKVSAELEFCEIEPWRQFHENGFDRNLREKSISYEHVCKNCFLNIF
jgi:hypothetical protein